MSAERVTRLGRARPTTIAIGGLLALALAPAADAHAGGLVVTGGSPRSIGRAGTGTVSDDGGGALLVNPAAMARRDGARAQVAVAFTDDEIAWQMTPEAPIARNQAASEVAPYAAVIASVGPWVIGAGVMTSAVSKRSLQPPGDRPPEDYQNQFEFRYAGILGAIRRDTITVGAARRLGDSVAVGLALGASRVTISELRHIWAGFSGVFEVGAPQKDVEISLSGTDWFVPSAVAGALIAPEGIPFEFAASVGWSQRVRLDADVGAVGVPGGPIVEQLAPAAALSVSQPWSVRAGARYLSERFVAEIGGDLWIAPASAKSEEWRVSGIRLMDTPGGRMTEVTRVPSRISTRTHGAVRGAVDVELLGGFLWATAGYAFALAGAAGSRQSPTFGDLGGHTFAVGLEATTSGFTFTAGWSRTWSVTRHLHSALQHDNPFNPADDKLCPPGTFDGSIDQLGVLVDTEF